MSSAIGPSGKAYHSQATPKVPPKAPALSARVNSQPIPPLTTDRPPEESGSSFSAIMREATDGDATEQIALASLGGARRESNRREDRRREDKDSRAGSSSGARKQPEAQDADIDFDPLQLLRSRSTENSGGGASSRPTTEAAGRSDRTGIKPDKAQRLSHRHETLMVVSSAMQPRQIATHVSQQVFEPLLRLFAQPLWRPVPDGNEKLVAAQMRAANKHVA